MWLSRRANWVWQLAWLLTCYVTLGRSLCPWGYSFLNSKWAWSLGTVKCMDMLLAKKRLLATISFSVRRESCTWGWIWGDWVASGLLFLAAFHIFLPCSNKNSNLQILCKYWVYSNDFVECSSFLVWWLMWFSQCVVPPPKASLASPAN